MNASAVGRAIGRLSDTKAFSIFFRSHRHLLKKSPAQSLLVTKTGERGDPLKWHLIGFQVLPRGLYPEGLDPLAWCGAKLRSKLSLEGTRPHGDASSQRPYIQLTLHTPPAP